MWEKKRRFEYSPGKFVKLHFKGPFIAMANGVSIKIDEYFDRLSLNEQRAIIWHELYHKNTNGTRLLWLQFKSLFKKSKYNPYQLMEFEADEHAARNVGKEITIKALKKIKYLIDKKIVPQNLKNHPPIEDRIKRIENMK